MVLLPERITIIPKGFEPFYLEHICVVVMAVLHHHRLVPRQSEGDAVLPAAVDGLQQQHKQKPFLHILEHSPITRVCC